MKQLLPKGWPRPKGYSNGISVENGRTIYVAGLIGWDENEAIVSDRLVDQLKKILENTLEVLAVDGAGAEHVVRMTWYIKDKREYLDNLADIGQVYRDVMGHNYPAMACLQVADLMEDGARIEIETPAVVPN